MISNVGDREHNEDSVYSEIIKRGEKESGIFVLADGLGGHGRGEVASGIVIETARKVFQAVDPCAGMIESIFDHAQESLISLQKKEHADDEMKTTAVILLVMGQSMYWGHVGDSRLYFFRKQKLVTRTLDHSVPQMLVNAGELKEKKIRKHPDRNKLLRVMGTDWDEPRYVVSGMQELMPGDAFLLCSDGFWENITEKQMLRCLKKTSNAADWLDKMNLLVQKSGEKTDMDNNSAIAVRIIG